jgi:hypothetical protein
MNYQNLFDGLYYYMVLQYIDEVKDSSEEFKIVKKIAEERFKKFKDLLKLEIINSIEKRKIEGRRGEEL